MITKDQLQNEILRLRSTAGSDYGDNVIPAIRLYLSLLNFEDRRTFTEILNDWLRSEDMALREYAVTLCLGFVVFRDVVAPPGK